METTEGNKREQREKEVRKGVKDRRENKKPRKEKGIRK